MVRSVLLLLLCGFASVVVAQRFCDGQPRNYITQAQLKTLKPGWSVDETQKIVTIFAVERLDCWKGTTLAVLDNGKLLTYPYEARLSCEYVQSPFGLKLSVVNPPQANVQNGARPFACIREGCPPLSYLSAANMAGQTTWSIDGGQKLQTLNTDDRALLFKCAAGTAFAAFSGGRLVVLPGATLSCNAATKFKWQLYDPARGNLDYGLEPYACVKGGQINPVKCPKPILDMPAALLPAGKAYVPLDFVTTGDVTDVRCPAGATFAYVDGGRLITADYYMRCDASTSYLYRTRSEARAGQDGAYGATIPVGCIKTAATLPNPCPALSTLQTSQLKPGWSLDAQQRLETLSDGTLQFKCAAGTSFGAYHGGTLVVLPGANLTCSVGTKSQWILYDPPRGSLGYGLEPYGCVKATPPNPCPVLATLQTSQLTPGWSIDAQQRLETLSDGSLQFKCAAGTSFGAYHGGTLVVLPGANLTCNVGTKSQWILYDPPRGSLGYGLEPYGCVKATPPNPCPVLATLQTSQLKPGWSIDAQQRLETLADGSLQFKCAAGTSFGAYHGGTLVVLPGANLTCNVGTKSQWILYDPPRGSLGYGLEPYGCVKDTSALPTQCQTGILYWSGTEQMIADNAKSYTWLPDKATNVNGQWKLNCPAGVGYQETATRFTYSPDMKIYCGASGWMLTTNNVPNGQPLSPVKVGCFTRK